MSNWDPDYVIYLVANGVMGCFVLWLAWALIRSVRGNGRQEDMRDGVRIVVETKRGEKDEREYEPRAWRFNFSFLFNRKVLIGLCSLPFIVAYGERHIGNIPRPSDDHPIAQKTVDFWHENSEIICKVVDILEEFIPSDRDDRY